VKRARRIAWFAALCLWTAVRAEGRQPSGATAWSEVRVPGGVAAVARALDLGPSVEPERLLPLLARRLYGIPAALHEPTTERVRRLEQLLAADGGLRAPEEGETIPLPLSPHAWARAVFRTSVPDDRLFAAIAGDRRAALLACGLAALDEGTLRALDASAPLLSPIADRHAARFAAFGRSLRLRDGRVETPGGDEARPLWEAAVGASVAAPERFVDALLARDGGRLAYLYDTIAALDPARARFALGLWLPEERRLDRFAALVAGFGGAYRHEWQPDERPFVRFSADAAWLLTQVAVGADGAPRGPAWRSLWERVFESRDVPAEPVAFGASALSGAVDAATLVGLVAQGPRGERASRLATFAFGQRVFGDVAPEEAAALLVALRAYRRYPMLGASLERIGVKAPALHAAAARRAVDLMSADPGRAGLATRQFQGALVLVTQARLTRVIDRETAERLVRSLVALRLNDGRYDGAVASWIRDSLLPALPLSPGSIEDRALAALAGIGTTARGVHARVITWEGRSYRVDLPASELARLRRVRSRQGGVTLDEALAVSDLAAVMTAGIPAERAAEIQQAIETIALQVRAIGPRVLPASTGWPPAAAILNETLVHLARPLPDNGVVPTARALVGLGDALVAEVLTSFAYATAFRDPDDRFLLGSNVAHRHDLGLESANPDLRAHAAWRLPEPQTQPGVPWYVLGSVLNLDVGLSGSALRRLGFDGELRAPVLNNNDRRSFSEAVPLTNPFVLEDADRDAIAAAVSEGRARVVASGTDAASLRALAAEASLDAWRREQILWLARRAPDRLTGVFTLSELAVLGRLPESVPLDSWGASSIAADGCLCTRFLATPDWPSVTGRADVGLLAARLPDLTLRVVELMASLGLPAALTRDILSVATLEFIERVQPADGDDWLTLSREAAALTREQVEDYASALTAGGPLMPIAAGGRAP
jgi:hypothetical protein